MAQDNDGAVWGTITLAMPQLIEWQIEGGETRIEGSSLREFMAALSSASEGCDAVCGLTLWFPCDAVSP